MPETPPDDIFALNVFRILRDYFDITLYRTREKEVFFQANPVLHRRGWKRELNRRLAQIQARVKIARDGDRYFLTASPLPRTLGRPPLVNILLFILTFLTVLLMATFTQVGEEVFDNPALLTRGLPFTLVLLTILLVHEMGHFRAGHKRGVIMSYPYFIPAPTFLGTFGAVIRSRTPIRTKNDLIMVGAAGPLAGAVPAILAIAWGYSQSPIAPIPEGPILGFGHSLLTLLVQQIMFGPVPDGYGLHLSSIALAGQVGLLVTMLNLLPLGQLDGGHIMYGLFGRRQYKLAAIFMAGLFFLGWFYWKGWWLWLVIATLMRPFHPPVIDESTPLDRKHRIIGWAAIILFILTFAPLPIY